MDEPVERYYGWLPDIPDFRDYYYEAAPDLVAALPPSTNNRAKFPVGPYDQGRLGSCGPNSAAGDIQWDGIQQGTLLTPSRLYMYYVVRMQQGTINQDSGVSNREMMSALSQWGWCDESLWPYDINKFRQKPSQEAFDQGEKRKIDVYLRVPQILEQMKGCLAGGDPFVFGFTVYSSFEAGSTSRTGIVPMPARTESVRGGHDILFVDYDDAKQWFIFRNSWGTGWGDMGWGYFPYAYALNPNMSADFWTIRWKVPAPIPPSPPQPIPNPPGPVVGEFTVPAGTYRITRV